MKRWSHGEVGLVLAAEEHSAEQLVYTALAAERRGVGYLFFSDHFHPWNLNQGHSSFLWSVLGAVAAKTERVGLVSAVTCPIGRIHPAVLAQAASTVYHLSAGRFVLGLGTGEKLNEHITGEPWPRYGERLARLEEAVDFVRLVLTGEEVSRKGKFFQLDRCQLFDPAPNLPMLLGASGPSTAQAAQRLGLGLITLGARPELVDSLPPSLPRLVQVSVCWDRDKSRALEIAHRLFPEVAMEGNLFTKLATPREYSMQAAEISLNDIDATIVTGPEAEPYRELVRQCLESGYDGVTFHQIGPEQLGFLDFLSEEGLLA